jgi:hypothetical protein
LNIIGAYNIRSVINFSCGYPLQVLATNHPHKSSAVGFPLLSASPLALKYYLALTASPEIL